MPQLRIGVGSGDEDPDVAAERSRVQNGVVDVVQIKGLTKVHDHHRPLLQLWQFYGSRLGQPPKLAVRNLWFGVPKGEVFGFLGIGAWCRMLANLLSGINGAGKTTALQMLTGDEIPSDGEGGATD